MTHAIDYSVVIPAYNEARFLPATLVALNRVMRELDQNGEVLVVDNNSSDDTADVARANGAKVVFEPLNQISRARNAGALASVGPLLIFIDADTIVDAALLKAALDSFGRGDICGGGAHLRCDGAHISAHIATKLWNCFARHARLAAGCFIFVRRDAFDAVAGFSETLYASEEIWFARSIKKWGRANAKKFIVLDEVAVTSSRKLDWFSSATLVKQMLIFLVFPWAVRSKRLCSAWYKRPADSSRDA